MQCTSHAKTTDGSNFRVKHRTSHNVFAFSSCQPVRFVQGSDFKTSYHFQRKQYSINSFAKFTIDFDFFFFFFYSERENFTSKSTSRSFKRKKYISKSISRTREIDFNIDESKLQTWEIDFKIDQSKFQTWEIYFKIDKSESYKRENFTSKSAESEFETREFRFKIDKSKFRTREIWLKIGKSKFELLGEEIRQMAIRRILWKWNNVPFIMYSKTGHVLLVQTQMRQLRISRRPTVFQLLSRYVNPVAAVC